MLYYLLYVNYKTEGKMLHEVKTRSYMDDYE